MSTMPHHIKPRVYVLRRPGLFIATETWYVQRGGLYASSNHEARDNAHEYTTLRAAKYAQRKAYPNYQVWRRGPRLPNSAARSETDSAAARMRSERKQ